MDYEITYSPHRIICTAVINSSMTIRYQFMPMYGPFEWLDFEPKTQVRLDAASSEGGNK